MDWVGILFTVLAAVLAVGIVAGVVVWRYVQKKRGNADEEGEGQYDRS